MKMTRMTRMQMTRARSMVMALSLLPPQYSRNPRRPKPLGVEVSGRIRAVSSWFTAMRCCHYTTDTEARRGVGPRYVRFAGDGLAIQPTSRDDDHSVGRAGIEPASSVGPVFYRHLSAQRNPTRGWTSRLGPAAVHCASKRSTVGMEEGQGFEPWEVSLYSLATSRITALPTFRDRYFERPDRRNGSSGWGRTSVSAVTAHLPAIERQRISLVGFEPT